MLKCISKNILIAPARNVNLIFAVPSAAEWRIIMKKILSLLLALVILSLSVFALASCGAPENDGAKISVYLGDTVYDFDPSDYYVDSNAEQLMSLLYEPLFAIDKDGELVKAAAKRYEVDEEKREIEIELRESYWSNGDIVVADDFLYAWRDILLNPHKPNPAAVLLYDIENAREIKNGSISNSELGIEAGNDTIKITYREGADYEQLLRNLATVATSPINQECASSAEAYWSKTANTIYTNGPFQISTLDYDEGELTLERNLGFHQDPNKKDYDNVVIPHQLVSFFTIDGHEVDATYENIDDTIFYMGNASLFERKLYKNSAVTADLLSTYTYVFNTESPLLAIKEVRQALSMAIDRNAIINEVVFGKAAESFLAPGASADIAAELISGEAKLDDAKALLASVDFTGIDKTIRIAVNNDDESRRVSDIIKATWTSLGFEVTVDYLGYIASIQLDFSTNTNVEILDSGIQYYTKEASFGVREYDVIAVDWQMFTNDPFVALSSFTSTTNGNGATFKDAETTYRKNISGWSSADYDALIEAAYTAADKTARNEALKSAEAMLIDEAPIVPLYYNQNFYYSSAELSELELDGFGHIVFTEAKLKDYEKYFSDEK